MKHHTTERMKKRIWTLGLVLVLSMAMLAGCGKGSAEDYLNDITEFSKLSEIDTDSLEASEDVDSYINTLISALDGMNMKTSEGKAIQATLKETIQTTGDAMAGLLSMDEAAILDLQTKLDKLGDKLNEQAEKFVDAALDAGLTAEDLEGINLDFGL